MRDWPERLWLTVGPGFCCATPTQRRLARDTTTVTAD